MQPFGEPLWPALMLKTCVSFSILLHPEAYPEQRPNSANGKAQRIPETKTVTFVLCLRSMHLVWDLMAKEDCCKHRFGGWNFKVNLIHLQRSLGQSTTGLSYILNSTKTSKILKNSRETISLNNVYILNLHTMLGPIHEFVCTVFKFKFCNSYGLNCRKILYLWWWGKVEDLTELLMTDLTELKPSGFQMKVVSASLHFGKRAWPAFCRVTGRKVQHLVRILLWIKKYDQHYIIHITNSITRMKTGLVLFLIPTTFRGM